MNPLRSLLQRLRGLSIPGRSFLLVFAALVVAESIGLLLVVNRPPQRNAPASIEDIASGLRGADEPRRLPPGGIHDPGQAPGQVPGQGLGGGPGPGFGPPQDFGPQGFGPQAFQPPGFQPQGFGPPSGPRPDAPRLRIEERTAPPPARADLDTEASARAAALLAARLQIPATDLVVQIPRRMQARNPSGAGLVAARHLSSGRWRTVTSVVEGFPDSFQRQVILLTLLGFALLLPLAWAFARALSAPLRSFAEGAQRLGRDPAAPPLTGSGPPEMRAAVDAFNVMQARLNRLLQERTQMIAAIAHDLRTPLTRLAFRLDDLPAPLHDKVAADIQEMKAMISAALDFIRERATAGTRERLDLRLLVERIVDDQADLGHDISFAAGAPVTVEGVPLALRRMVVNLVENALKYGERARLRLGTADGQAVLEIDDDGPGIPENRHEQVFEPFYRLEASRNRDTGGIGLGLATVRAIALDHGGEIMLGNRSGGGLRVTLRLPLAA